MFSVIIFILIIYTIVNSNRSFTIILGTYLIFILSMVIIPIIRNYVKYPHWMHSIFYYFPLYMSPILFKTINFTNFKNEKIYIGLIIGIVMLLSKYDEVKKAITGERVYSLKKISKYEFIVMTSGYLMAVVSEELYFRVFIIEVINSSIGLYSIVLSSILFVFSHWMNRWADKMFSLKSYCYHALIGIVLATYYYYFTSVLGCIIAHIIFNLPAFLIAYKQMRKEEEVFAFNDY